MRIRFAVTLAVLGLLGYKYKNTLYIGCGSPTTSPAIIQHREEELLKQHKMTFYVTVKAESKED